MVEALTFPIVIKIKPTNNERIIAFFFICFCLLPFIYGIVTRKFHYCWSLIIGLFASACYEHFSNKNLKSKITTENIKNISFNENEISIFCKNELKTFSWENLTNIEINIIAYKNRHQDEDRNYDGTENFFTFTYNQEEQKVFFYIDKQKRFNFLSDYFKKIILPKLYHLKNIKQDSILISKLNYHELQEF